MAKAFLYNGNVQTKLIEAVNDVTNHSTEFRFEPNQMIISGLRLANVGLYGIICKIFAAVGKGFGFGILTTSFSIESYA